MQVCRLDLFFMRHCFRSYLKNNLDCAKGADLVMVE